MVDLVDRIATAIKAQAHKHMSTCGEESEYCVGHDYWRDFGVAVIEELGLEIEECELENGPEYIVTSEMGGAGMLSYGGLSIRRNPDFKFILSHRYITDWMPNE